MDAYLKTGLEYLTLAIEALSHGTNTLDDYPDLLDVEGKASKIIDLNRELKVIKYELENLLDD